VIWLFAGQAAVLETLPPRRALGRSAELVRGASWHVLSVLLVVQAAATGLEYLLLWPVADAASGLDHAGEVVAVGTWRIVVAAIVEPFALIVIALLYLDRRLRAEGGRLSLARPHEVPDLVHEGNRV
jgi:hypothetical protein